jgi:hypothetical protein
VIVDNNKDDEEDDTFLVEEAPPVTQEVVHVSIDCTVFGYDRHYFVGLATRENLHVVTY